jgi:chemotaxis protein MotB
MSEKKVRGKKAIHWNSHRYEEDEGGGEENWLISYADLMTLMFGFFVIISSLSTPNTEKVEKLKKQTAESMGEKYVQPFNSLSNRIKNILNQQSLKSVVGVESASEGLILTAGSTTFFAPGSDELLPDAEKTLTDLGNILVEHASDFNLVIEGHTDDIPITTTKFPSNWELSVQRATKVVRLFESLGFAHSSLRPVGLSDTEPLVSILNLTPEELPAAREKNRRIVIKVIKKLPLR